LVRWPFWRTVFADILWGMVLSLQNSRAYLSLAPTTLPEGWAPFTAVKKGRGWLFGSGLLVLFSPTTRAVVSEFFK